MKRVTYYPRRSTASHILTFLVPYDREVKLIAETPIEIPNRVDKWLNDNVDEYRECVEQNIIIVKDIPGTDAGVSSVKDEEKTPPPQESETAKVASKK